MAHAYNPSHLGGLNQEDCGSGPAQANSSGNPISKIIRAKWTGGMAEEGQCLLCKYEALSSNLSLTKKCVYMCE
jgi:hypothetical protein